MATNYTKEQIEDVQAREAKALAYLKELQLTPAAQLSWESIGDGDDRFVARMQPYLQDLKYQDIKSPFIPQ